jgi:transposase
MSQTRQAAQTSEHIAKRTETLYMALELSGKNWKLGFSDGKRASCRIVSVKARDWEAVEQAIQRARQRFELMEAVRIISCYEAGRDGFWLHRALWERGIENIVVDAASIEVNRRDRRAKTDRMDAEKLVGQLIRYDGGEKKVWSVVRVPDEAAEDERQLHREMEILKRERVQHRIRIQSLLVTKGIQLTVGSGFLQKLERLRLWNGKPVSEQLKQRLQREYQRLQLVQVNLRELEKQQLARLKAERSEVMEKIRRLQQLRGIGVTSAWIFVMELFGWRQLENRRQVAAAVGLTPTPYQSGESRKEQGISHSGNRRVRSLTVEIAWSWLRLQPDSELSRWYRKRFSGGGARMRKIGIVALARRLVIDLWRYLERGIVPAGARLKSC